MLYIASTLTPTAVTHSLAVTGFTGEGKSLVVAKPDCVEVWDVTATGLVFRGDLRLWGTVAGLAVTNVSDARPHLLVLIGPPNAQLHLVTWSPSSDELVITSSLKLAPPTPALRRQEFFTAVISDRNVALVSLWTGLLSCVEIELAKKGRKKDMDVDGERKLVFRNNFNMNIREHNLLDLAFVPSEESAQPVLNFLWMSEENKILLQPRALSLQAHSFTDLATRTDVVNPLDLPMSDSDDPNFLEIDFSCPAGRSLLSLGAGTNGCRYFLVMGDEFSVMYAINSVPTSPRLAAKGPVKRSPRSDAGGTGKKRKSSQSGRSVNTDPEPQWSVQPMWRIRQGFGTILAATLMDRHTTGGSLLMGDEYGRLTAVGWKFDDAEKMQVGVVDMGVVSAPSSLTYLDNGFLFASSACGDSLLVSLVLPPLDSARQASNKGKERAHDISDAGAYEIITAEPQQGQVDVRERWMNIAPAKDFAIVKDEDGRVSHIVVASGSASSNSFRVVRSGVGFENILTIEECPGIERMWTLPVGDGPSLLISFAYSTTLLQLEPDVKVFAAAEAVTSVPTFAAGLVDGSLLLQATPEGIRLWSDLASGKLVDKVEATEDNRIVTANVRDDVVIAAFRDGAVKVFRASSQGLQEEVSVNRPREVSAVEVLPSSSYFAIADWDGNIELLSLGGTEKGSVLKTFHEAAYATTLQFQTSGKQPPRLLAGLSDGTFVSYSLKSDAPETRHASSLGSRPLRLIALDISPNGEEHVVAAGISDRLSLVFESRDHFEFSSSGKKNVVAATSLSTPSLGDCIALATPTGIVFERLTSLKKLQVQTLDLGERSATRVSALPGSNMIIAGAVTRSMDQQTGDVLQSSSVELRNATTLELLSDFQLPEREAVASVNAVTLHGRQYILVGTAVFDSDDALEDATLEDVTSFIATNRGRLLLFQAAESSSGTSLDLLTSLTFNGPVYDTVVIHGFLAVATATKVSILRLTSQPVSLNEAASFAFAFETHHLAVVEIDAEKRLVVGDAMRSIIVLSVDPESGDIVGDQRDMNAHLVRSLSSVHDVEPGVIIADNYANLLTFRLEKGITPAASIGLNEDVTRIQPGTLAPVSAEGDILNAELLCTTVNGRLGVIGELGKGAIRTLDDLQRNMNKLYKGPGGLEWKDFRRSGNMLVPRETVGFIDGDFVQQFAELDAELQDKILSGTSAPEAVSKVTDGELEDASEADVERILEVVGTLH